MVATYRLRADEITENFLKNIRDNYQDKEIEITIQEVEDETEYLLKDQQLLKAVEDIKKGKNLVSVSLDSLP